jgi:ankyrin repeat protein
MTTEGSEFDRALQDGDIERLDRLADAAPHALGDLAERLLDAVALHPQATIQWLIARGAPVRIAAPDGFPVLHMAVDRRGDDRYAVMTTLLDAGADINERGVNDWTPLHRAALGRGDVRMVRLLLERGADRTIRTIIDDRQTAEEEARSHGLFAIADLIGDWRPPRGGKAGARDRRRAGRAE